MNTSASPQTAAEPALLANYNRLPVNFVRGEGCELIDDRGERYLDMVAGIAVCALGHAHPAITEAVARQAGTLIHCSNLYHHEPAGTLANELARRSGFARVFFCNSGAEANEAAIKLARKRAFRRGEAGRRTILSATDGFHGRTMGALTATANAKYQEGFDPLPAGFRYTAFNEIEALERDLTDDVAAFLIEPVQGESGVWPATQAYLERARQLCDERGALLIFDEIQCGIGRLGPLFAWQHFGVRPDAFTLAKALANGLPIGALLMSESCADVLRPGDHGTTFGGSPVPSAAALAHLTWRDANDLQSAVARSGALLTQQLTALTAEFPHVFGAVRGAGLMLGLPVREPYQAGDISQRAFARKVLINAAGHNTLRFVPPLIIGDAQISHACAVLREVAAAL